jgi:hypothetical protein
MDSVLFNPLIQPVNLSIPRKPPQKPPFQTLDSLAMAWELPYTFSSRTLLTGTVPSIFRVPHA